MMKRKHTRWKDPDEVPVNGLYIAWINGTELSHYRLLAKDYLYDKNGKKTGAIVWTDEHADMKIPRKWIKAVHNLPDMTLIGPDWMGD